jgi:hypothetical protein
MRMYRSILASLVLVPLLALVVLPTYASVINFQGRLTDPTNCEEPIQGLRDITFRLYSEAGVPLPEGSPWEETSGDVNIVDGLVSILVGSNVAIPTSVIRRDPIYLGITVNLPGQLGESEMVPRTRIVPAYRASLADFADHAETANALVGTPFGMKPYIPPNSGLPEDDRNYIVYTTYLGQASAFPVWSIPLRNVPSGLDNGSHPNPFVNAGDHLPNAPVDTPLYVQCRVVLTTKVSHDDTFAEVWFGSTYLPFRPVIRSGGCATIPDQLTYNLETEILELAVGPDQILNVQLKTTLYCEARLYLEVIGWKLIR